MVTLTKVLAEKLKFGCSKWKPHMFLYDLFSLIIFSYCVVFTNISAINFENKGVSIEQR